MKHFVIAVNFANAFGLSWSDIISVILIVIVVSVKGFVFISAVIYFFTSACISICTCAQYLL